MHAQVDYCEQCRNELLGDKKTLAAAAALSAVLRGVGYWCQCQGDGSELPDPRTLVMDCWRQAERDRIVRYLRAGHTLRAYMGYSFCRFNCGIEHAVMGSRDLTDGTWVWPEGLAHYVVRHSVRLPEEFVASMEARNWLVPGEETLPSTSARIRASKDLSYWIAWARCEQRPNSAVHEPPRVKTE